MPKMKSNRAAKKRFRATGSGKIRRNKAFANHILTKKSAKRKRNLRDATLAAPSDNGRIKRMILAE
ncbi:MAG: 50S ribosomal protein L35 [Candidatus Krumholzibacteriia bacterium]|nr:50S ribosomal protein L35 [bacterium]MCB9515094.1 50S ribosomal protein L35 [Candidatus Latescibacterota bacterium]